MKLPLSFYQRDDAILIARELLGKHLYTRIGGVITGGVIVETEAYKGPEDRGSHAYNHRRTPRNEMMFSAGGVVYMYICYGIHDMLNIVTGKDGVSHAVLVRAIEPTVGVEVMRQRRNLFTEDTRLGRGPGALAKALGLLKAHNGISLLEDIIWLEDTNEKLNNNDVIASARVGMNFDGPYKAIPWRFYVRGNRNVSKPHI